MFSDMPVKDYLEQTAAPSPVPGGGSVAALGAALAAALVKMVAGLTADRKGFQSVTAEMKDIAATAATLGSRCLEDIDRDPEAYRQVLAAYRLPQDTADDKAQRALAVQEALKKASLVPLALAERAYHILDSAGEVIRKGNPNAASDGAVAALMARSAGLAAICNVRINLATVKDRAFVEEVTRKVEKLEKQLIGRENEILGEFFK